MRGCFVWCEGREERMNDLGFAITLFLDVTATASNSSWSISHRFTYNWLVTLFVVWLDRGSALLFIDIQDFFGIPIDR
jgi:hypothetical protein